MDNPIPFEKILEKYGKACLEREMAFESLALVQKANDKLRKEIERLTEKEG